MSSSAAAKLKLKTNFAIKNQWEPFYTGGSVVPADGGKTLLCCCGDAVKVIDIATGKLTVSISQNEDEVTCVCCSPDNEIIVSATRSMLLKQWKIEDNVSECVRTWKAIHSTPVLCMDFDPTSTLLATGSSDSTIKIWDMINQYCTHNLRGSQGVITVIKFHPRDLRLFSASNDYVIRTWDLQTSRCICLLDCHVSAVTSLAFYSPNDTSTMLLSAGRDKIICVWDLNAITPQDSKVEPVKAVPVYESIEGMLVPSNDDVSKLINSAAAEDGIYTITAGESGILKLWNLKTATCVYPSKAEIEGKANSSAITHLMHLKELKRYASVTFDHNINVFDLKNGFVEDKHLIGYNDEVLDVRFVGVKDSHVVVATNSPLVKLFDLKSASCQLLSGHEDTVLCLGAFKDGLTFVTGSKDNSVRLWKMDKDSKAAPCVAVGRSHTRDVTALATSWLKSNLFVSGSQDLTLKIWGIVVSANGENSETVLKVKHTIKAHDKDVNSVAISPNDKLIATGSQDKTAKLWSVADGQLQGVFSGHKRGIWSCQFSPSDQVLGTSSADGTIRLWLLSDFTCLKTMEGHDCSILKMIFISKGAQIMSSGSDGLVKMWNIKSSECVKTFDGHDDKVWGLAVNSANTIVISAAADSKIIFWEDVTEKEIDEAHKVQETSILRQQTLNNLIHEKRFSKAFRMAITLEQPFTALKVLKEMKWEDDSSDAIKDAVENLRDDQKDTLLKFIMSWNTNSRNCHEAQLVLNLILKMTYPDDFMKFSNAQAAVEALLPYTDRHYQRMSRLLLNTTFVDYVCQMAKLKPIKLTGDSLPSEVNEEVKVYRSVMPAVHPLKRKPLNPKLANKRKRKPDTEEPPPLESVDTESKQELNGANMDTENLPLESIDTESKPKENDAEMEVGRVREKTPDLISPPRKMRLRSAKKSVTKRRYVT